MSSAETLFLAACGMMLAARLILTVLQGLLAMPGMAMPMPVVGSSNDIRIWGQLGGAGHYLAQGTPVTERRPAE